MSFNLENTITNARNEFENILDYILKDTDNQQINEVEKGIFKKILLLGLLLLKIFIQKVMLNPIEKFHTDLNSKRRIFHSMKTREYWSIFGKLNITRPYYWKKGKGGIFPLDAFLNLPEGKYSYLFYEWGTHLSVNEPYKKAAKFLEKILDISLWGSTFEDFSRKSYVNVKEYYSSLRPIDDDKSELIVLSVDCKGVQMRKDQLYNKTSRLRPNYRQLKKIGEKMKKNSQKEESGFEKAESKKQKNGKKKMSTITAVYTIDRYKRTAEDILSKSGGNMGKRNRKDVVYSRPNNKIVYGTLKEKNIAFEHLKKEVARRDPKNKKCIAVIDGELKLNELVSKNFSEVEIIRDIYHVTEYLWDAGHVFYRKGTKEAQKMVSRYYEMLLNGNVEIIIKELKESGNSQISEDKKKTLGRVITYLENGKKNMQYDRYIKEGYPIGSGVIEGTCKNLVNDRLEHSGMHWSIKGADAIIELRSLDLNNLLEDYLKFYISKERARLYENVYTGDQSEQLAA